MYWFKIEMEIFLYGKEFDMINAPDKETAKQIALKKAEKKYTCNSSYIEIINCNKQS
ncbi:hypothetical protein OA848_04990 [Rickettsiales bacterium]|nr:hypothetical protein [Rickettsiales bacterium]